MVVPGCGGGAFWHGRRRPSQSVRLCFLTLFCRTLFLTGGDGLSILSMVTLSKGPTSILRLRILSWSGALLIWCGWSTFRLRFPCLFGGFLETDCQQKTIWFVGGYFSRRTTAVLEAVAPWRHRFTSFCAVTFLAACGISFISGLVSLSYHQTWLLITYTTSAIWRVYRGTHTFIFKWFDTLLRGSFGRSEIIGFLRTKLRIWLSY